MPEEHDIRLTEALNGNTENYLLPFYWQNGNSYETLSDQISQICKTGERAFCVESRPHPDFVGPLWWRDMDLILSEAAKLGMKVWILDDDHFPTGHANGTVKRDHPELLPRCIAETHTDIIGPKRGATFFLRTLTPEDEILGVFAYRRVPLSDEEAICGEPVDLTGQCRDRRLSFDVPEGCWRVFTILKTSAGTDDCIDMMRAESVRLLIDETYEKHWQHYSRYFGTTLAGFFSDEPRINCGKVSDQPRLSGFYEKTVGIPGIGLPYSDDMSRISSLCNFIQNAPLLWYPHENAPDLRLAYMNVVTEKYRDNFVRPIGDWCRGHGVSYIGHIIEDMNCHARLGCSSGHYFRAMDGQDMSGIDIVLHQILPGFADYNNSSITAGGVADSAFFHYVLGQLAASDAHTDQKKQGRAMCEVFGAYGWAEGSALEKWLIDFLLVRGINYFVPHAFAPDFPFPDCPPHFGFPEIDPQHEAFCELMRYTNRMSHLLSGPETVHHADAAVLYHGEAEWMNGSLYLHHSGRYMFTQEPAKVLLDDHITYDILCSDILTGSAFIQNGMLKAGKESYQSLILPYAERLPEKLCSWIISAVNDGLTVIMADGINPCPALLPYIKLLPLEDIPANLRSSGLVSVNIKEHFPLLRHYHISRGATDIYMFFNENSAETADVHISLPENRSSYLRIGDMFGSVTRGQISSGVQGTIPLTLAPYESAVFVFGADSNILLSYPEADIYGAPEVLHPHYNISLADHKSMKEFIPYTDTDILININSPEAQPDFSGRIKYDFTCDIAGSAEYCIDLGEAGNAVTLAVDGCDKGIRICRPYRFVLGRLEKGSHTFTVTASCTLAGVVRDRFSAYMYTEPAGILGPVTLRTRQ